MAWDPSRRNLIIIALIVVMMVIVMVMMFSKKDKKADKEKVKESFVDEIHRKDDGIFSLFNWSSNEESSNQIIENFPQATPMNVIYTDTNGNLSNTSDLGLQNLTVNGDISIGGNLKVANGKMITVRDDNHAIGHCRIWGSGRDGTTVLGWDGGILASNSNGYKEALVWDNNKNVKINGNLSTDGALSINGYSDIKNTLDNIYARLSALDNKIETRATALETRATNLETRATALEKRAGSLETNTTSLNERADKLEAFKGQFDGYDMKPACVRWASDPWRNTIGYEDTCTGNSNGWNAGFGTLLPKKK